MTFCSSAIAPLFYLIPGIMFTAFFFLVLMKYNRAIELMDISDMERLAAKKDWLKPANWFNPRKPGLYMIIGDILLIIGVILYIIECH